jgi:translation initiation factor 1
MKKKSVPLAGEGPPQALSSLGDLLRQRGVAVAGAPPAAAPEPAASAPVADGDPDLRAAGRLVVRRERKGHGGKTVTVIDGLDLPEAAGAALARAMRRALGCGSWVDDGRVVLQGDRADAAAAWLTRRGARQIIRGN